MFHRAIDMALLDGTALAVTFQNGAVKKYDKKGRLNMEKFIPYAKLSKKKKRELDARRRSTWTINPVTRKPANPKAYNRNKAQKWRDEDSVSVPCM